MLTQNQSMALDTSGTSSSPSNLPLSWMGFAHPDHQADELESLVRTLRYALIDLQKFWVEVQSIPVFMNGLKACTLQELEGIFQWVLNAPEWSEKITYPRLVVELTHAESRKRIQEFAQTVLCVRVLKEELALKFDAMPSDPAGLDVLWQALQKAQALCQRQKAGNLTLQQLDGRIKSATESRDEVRRIQMFFSKVADRTGAPLPSDTLEGLRVLKALECVLKMPENVRSWRTRPVLDAAQRIRLQTWRDRARPTLELRKRLETFFDLSSTLTTEELRRLASELKNDGLLSQFKAPYREALEKYRSLLKDREAHKQDGKLNGFQKAERLFEWIALIDQSRAFMLHAEARTAFAPHFQGIDTDFSSALEANAWAQMLRSDLFESGSEARTLAFDTAILDFITQIPENRIQAAGDLIQSSEAAEVRELLEAPALEHGPVLKNLENERGRRCLELEQLRELGHKVKFQPELPLTALLEAMSRVEEVWFLVLRMGADEKLKTSLKEIYAGVETDLTLIEPCAAYVKAVRLAGLPEGLVTSLLSTHGPQRLEDARGLVRRCLTSMAVVREHFRRLEVATREQIRIHSHGKSLESAPVVELMDRIQGALKEAQRVGKAVSELRRARDGARIGLKMGRDGADVTASQQV